MPKIIKMANVLWSYSKVKVAHFMDPRTLYI